MGCNPPRHSSLEPMGCGKLTADGLVHGWFGVLPSDIQHTVALNAASQLIWNSPGYPCRVLPQLRDACARRLPAAFTILFVAFAAALVLLLINTLGPSVTAGKIAGVVVLVIGAAASYVFLAIASRASSGPEYPIGRPIAH
jgi:hypothetical protein